MDKLRGLAFQEFRRNKNKVIESLGWLGGVLEHLDDPLIMGIHLVTRRWTETQIEALHLKDSFTSKDCQTTKNTYKLNPREIAKAVLYIVQNFDSYDEFMKYPVPVDTTGAFVSQFRYLLWKKFEDAKRWKYKPLPSSENEDTISSSRPPQSGGGDETQDSGIIITVGARRHSDPNMLGSPTAKRQKVENTTHLQLVIGNEYMFKSATSHRSITASQIMNMYDGFRALYDDFTPFLNQRETEGFYVYEHNRLVSPHPVDTTKVSLYTMKRYEHIQKSQETV